MKNAPKRTSAVFMMIAAATIIPAALLAWGPSRQTFTTAKPADFVTFNSIIDNPAHGDERNFVQVRESTASNSTYADAISVTPGKEYTVFVYYHNNAASNLNSSGKGIARDVAARAEIPAVVPSGSNGTKAVGYIDSSNASPKTVWDDISFANKTGSDVRLSMVPGSAKIYNKGKTNGATLSDSIVTTGAKLGYDSLNGTLPGCNEYAGYVTFNVKASSTSFTATKQVRKLGETSWQENVKVNPGDKVEYLVSYKNTGEIRHENVTVRDTLPKNVSYVPGSTKLKNSNFPSGKTVSDNVVTGVGVNIGNYAPGGAGYLWFTAQVGTKESLDCGVNKLINTASVETDYGTKKDTADVTTEGKDCPKPPVKIEVCELDTKKIITIDEKDFDSKKHSKDLNDCKVVEPNKITVCELDTKKIITIDEKDFDSKKHSKDLNDCKTIVPPVTPPVTPPTTPETPAELPKTGPAEAILSIVGLGAMIASINYYLASRRALLGR